MTVDQNRHPVAPSEAGVGAKPAGQLEIAFEGDGAGRTYVGRQYASYPFHVCRAHYLDPELPGMATLYTQSSAGGLFDGDRLEITVAARADSQCHLTTQASTIVHRTSDGDARQDVRLIAEAGSVFEYLPDATILFPEARLRSRVALSMHESAQVILGEAYLAHDPDGHNRPFGWLDSAVVVSNQDGIPLMADRFRVTGDDWNRRDIGALGGFSAQATLLLLRPGKDPGDLREALCTALEGRPEIYGGVSELPNACGLWLRLLAVDGASLRSAMGAAWAAARIVATGCAPAPRRK
ncbi:MAG: urease accessory protein UreD [Alphaproteobacteria bacterium]|nr:urease accessory protein UreD [Alphaproteobacteria bacterium]